MRKPVTFHTWIHHRIVTARNLALFTLLGLIYTPFIVVDAIVKGLRRREG